MLRPLRICLVLVALACLTPASGVAASKGGALGFRLGQTTVTPKHPYFAGKRKIRLHYRFSARRPVDLRIDVIGAKSGDVVARWHERSARPGMKLKRAWNGVAENGKAAPDGRYRFRVAAAGERPRGAGSFRLRGHVFPVDGPHGIRGPVGDFHAPRNGGRIHEGFDITGDCGTPLVAARGGKVKRAGYDPVLYGNYALIDAAKSNQDYFYAHMVSPAEVGEGKRVFTGQQLGRIGQTGNAAGTPCHLHFEVRVHGTPIDPEPLLRDWDR